MPIALSENGAIHRSGFRMRLKCMYEGCKAEPIRSHTVPRQSLKHICDDKKMVIGFNDAFEALFKRDFAARANALPISQTSTFFGFCSEHDTDVFKSIEVGPFLISKWTLLLLSYRALARERYNKFANYQYFGDLYRTCREHQTWIANYFAEDEVFCDAMERGWNELSAIICDALTQPDPARHVDRPSLVSQGALVIKLDNPPPMMVSVAFFPDRDVNGKVIQRFSPEKTPSIMMFNCFATSEGEGAAIFTWPRDSPECTVPHRSIQYPCQSLAQSLLDAAPDKIAQALVRIACRQSDNVFLGVDWWKSISSDEQNYLLKLNSLKTEEFKEPVFLDACSLDSEAYDWKISEIIPLNFDLLEGI